MTRRTMLATLPLLGAAVVGGAAAARRPRILLRSSWATVNIGDVAHTPGVLRLLAKYLPEAEITLWPADVRHGVEEMLRRNFPDVALVQTTAEVARAFESCDFLLHGSGPSLVAHRQVARWRAETSKPYGVYGITVAGLDDTTKDLLNTAQFAFFRDSVSLQLARAKGVTCPVMEFGPDGAFACDLRDDAAAEAFLAANELTAGRYVCVIPRLRYTPRWLIEHRPLRPDEEPRRLRNEAQKEHDHGPLRAAILELLRQTDLKVLLCPEDQSQVAVGKELLYDRLPTKIIQRVVWRETFWLPDEALSTYVRSAGVFGLEMHSPIMALGNGIPALVGRFAEQTSKGAMWRDIGLGDWLFDFDQDDDLARLTPTVLAMVQDAAAAQAKVAKAAEFVHERQQATMGVLRRCVLG